MNKVNVALSGINRAIDDGISKDGACAELINMRVKNGSLEPVGRPILESKGFSGEPIFIHKNSDYEHIISYDGSTVYYDYIRSGEEYTSVKSVIRAIPNVTQVQSVGNTLIILTSEGIHYALFIDGKYKYLGEKPPFPVMTFYLGGVGQLTDTAGCTLTEKEDLSKVGTQDLNDANVTAVTNALNGTANKLISKATENGNIVYPIFVRYALKTFDSSYMLQSAPILLAPNNEPVKIIIESYSLDDKKLSAFSHKVGVNQYKLSYDISMGGASNLSDWKDVITSLDVFISKPIATVKLGDAIDTYTVTKANEKVEISFNKKTEAELKEDITSVGTFYKVKSFDIQDSYVGGNISDANLIANLEQKDTLPDDAFSHNTYTGEASYAYNARLHIGNIKEYLYSGYPLTQFCIKDNNGGGIWWGQYSTQESGGLSEMKGSTTCQVFLNTSEGERVVTWSGAITSYGLVPFLCYPDSRATRMVIRVTHGAEGSQTVYQKTFQLKAHDFLNLAYNFDQFTAIQLSQLNEAVTPLSADNNMVRSPNKIKVSEASNPFVFPAKYTYTCSQSGIVGMATATAALSTGQFGQFPLYVFTEDGIYALSTGDGEIAYASAYPVTRDVCNNPSSITSTDSEIVFSTDAGLMVLSGSQTQKISDAIEGWLPSFVGDSSPIIAKIANVAGSQDLLSTTEFVYYLEGAKIGYSYEDKEIIVANPSYGYSYVYNVPSGEWHKIDCQIKSFINSYPECLAIFSDSGLYNMHNSHRTINNVLLITKPIKFDTTEHKRVLQSALRGVIRPSESDVYYRGENVKFRGDNNVYIFSQCGFYVLGSNDAEHFVLLSGREKLTDIRDLITKMNKSKAYKYFMVALAGGVRTDVALNYIEFMVDATYSNRLR